jgi:hypothetical protein
MAQRIEDHALIGDCHTAALVTRDGTVDWACLPRFDSASTFAALLGDEHDGHWSLRPTDPDATPVRRHDGDSLVLSTIWTTATGVVEVTDFMPVEAHRATLVRRVRGLTGSVELQQVLRIRFGYGDVLPWIRQVGVDDEPVLVATAGPDAVVVRGPSPGTRRTASRRSRSTSTRPCTAPATGGTTGPPAPAPRARTPTPCGRP